MYLLAFMDTVERLDILLLEIRHLQQSIIYLLRTPALYRPLRYEGDYIFGNWTAFEKDNDAPNNKTTRAFDTFIASQSIIRYPSPRKAVSFFKKIEEENITIPFETDDENKNEKRENTDKVLKAKIGEIWLGDQWVRELRRHYYALRSLQILKQQVFRDKVTLFREAKDAELLNKKSITKSTKLPALMVLRSGIMFRINRYLNILQTHQQNFSKSVSYGIQGFPRPTTERRRQLGVFSDFLSETTVNLNKEMGHLLQEIMPKEELQEHNKRRPLQIHVLHGWSPEPRVSSSQLYDNIGRTTKIKEDGDGKIASRASKVEDSYYIDSSFWSPDCPAHQVLITKEIASLYITNLLSNMDDSFLSNSESHFAFLMRSLFRQINETTQAEDVPVLQSINDNIHQLIRDLAKDFLSVSIKGIPYIYSIFLANLGKGLESVLMHQGVIRLDRLHELQGGCRSINDYFEWYFRLRLSCYWMKQITHIPHHHIDKIVLQGCRQVCDEIIDYLDKCTPSTREPVGYLWQRLARELEKIIEKSPVVSQVHQWRRKRSKDKWNDVRNCAGERKYYRSTAKLDIHLQNYLFRKALLNKCQEDNPLHSFCNENKGYINEDMLAKAFYQQYKIAADTNKIPHIDGITLQHPHWLFRHLYDIPFQCSAMRSIDLIKPNNNNHNSDWKEFIHACHYDMSMGRNLFAIAMEFHIWSHESPRHRLSVVINLLEHYFKDFEKELKTPLINHLYIWLEGEPSKKENATIIYDEIKAISTAKALRKSCTEQWLKSFPATEIAACFAFIEQSPNIERRMEQLCGYKLREILNIFKENKNDDCFKKLLSSI